MNILNNQPQEVINTKQQAATRLVEFTRNSFDNLLRQWETGMILLWSEKVDENGNTFGAKEILENLGTDAKDLFVISEGLRSYLESLKPGCTDQIMAKYYKPVTIRKNGTVTLNKV
jgi:peptide subunit release factor 1 (eRF1)